MPPHVRGTHGPDLRGALSGRGPSPRAWGSPRRRLSDVTVLRSIPTCVGLTVGLQPVRIWSAVHPHVRGAHAFSLFFLAPASGPSPRAWGSRRAQGGSLVPRRSIPTCVGLTPTPPGHRAAAAVHPHVRGAHESTPSEGPPGYGPSPRAWGSQPREDYEGLQQRSTPTCVGLTWRPSGSRGRSPVHPHVRGAHADMERRDALATGPPPRAWGSRLMTCDNAGRYLCETYRPVKKPSASAPHHGTLRGADSTSRHVLTNARARRRTRAHRHKDHSPFPWLPPGPPTGTASRPGKPHLRA